MENENLVTIKHHLLEKELLREEGYSEEEDEGDEEEKEKEKESDCFLICGFFFLLVLSTCGGLHYCVWERIIYVQSSNNMGNSKA